MSVFDLPRLHFAGTACTRLPTGPRSGRYDLARNRALTADGLPFPPERPAREYHEHLDGLGARFEPDGRLTPEGRFGTVKGWNFGGNGHFWVDATVTGWEAEPGRPETHDPVVGRHVDLWGHYNDHLATTVNRARVFDVDPASEWTTTVMVGRFGFGRLGRSHEVGYLAAGGVTGYQPPRWQNARHVLEVGAHPLAGRFRRSVVHQFAVGEGLEWFPEADSSRAARRLRARLAEGGARGLVVRFALFNMATPQVPDAPDVWQVRGTIAPWLPGEERTCPAGRLLTGRATRRAGLPAPLHNAAVHLTQGHTTLDLVTAVPHTRRAAEPGPGPVHALGPRLDLGELRLCTRDSGRLVARVPREAYLGDTDATGGLVTVPTEPEVAAALAAGAVPDEPLLLTGAPPGERRRVLLEEEETVVRADDSALFLEPPRPVTGGDGAVEVAFRTYRLGRPAPVPGLRALQFFNPRALPADPRTAGGLAACGDVRIVDVRPAGPPGEPAGPRDGAGEERAANGPGGAGAGSGPGRAGAGEWAASCLLDTDEEGRGRLALRCAEPGATRLLLLPPGEEPPCDPAQPGSAARAYDNEDRLGYWPAVCAVDVRVLPDTWHLADIPPDEVTFELLYREVFAPWELLYSFMADEVFALADECKVATYARLVWLMCDPRNRGRTYFMPPTRDMTRPQAALLLAYLRREEAKRRRPPLLVPRRPRPGALTTRGAVHEALREAAAVELAVMLQYLYAAWSIPPHEAGAELVRRGQWTAGQLDLACGDGGETRHGGIRGLLLNVAREEMVHFLVINNIITAMGLPFHLPAIDFGTVNSRLRVPLDLCLEGFGLGSVQRFIAIEQPHGAGPGLAGEEPGRHEDGRPYPYQSLSDLYAAIREGIATVPGLFLVDRGRGGGEHHLFMRESVNAAHPDYQLEVDDVPSALFAIDFVTEHGEGNVLPGAGERHHEEESHYETFLRISDLLTAEHHGAAARRERGVRRPPWSPAYPVLRNPTLHPGNPAQEPVEEPEARAALRVFNDAYFLMCRLFLQHFGSTPDASLRRSELMNAAIDVMTGMLRPLAEHLVTLPSGRPGRTAGPSFELAEQPGAIPRPDVARRALGLGFARLAERADALPGLPGRVAELMRFYADRFGKAAG
ncbi:ferritin-like domain-containing protein [Streptomyces hoynatensis]|uniref:VioB-polyketide synthase n=1 Tax=Streptomyces hoynatensis TaxID=1141874 RepID=A0A3A9ZCS2_9ACTN|nr:ferritin-like domain-containing protein [Streptomyces hoynatensis]RKN45879.1 VioB - polyketide synthase [Streptomyces hoynatensis]